MHRRRKTYNVKNNVKTNLRHIFVVSLAVMGSSAAQAAPRTIKKSAPVQVSCPAGTAPRMPSRVWVTYSDGYSEYRQVKWTNYALSTEQAQADATRHPAGTAYELKGYIIGDDATDNGYPVTATVTVTAGAYATPAAATAE